MSPLNANGLVTEIVKATPDNFDGLMQEKRTSIANAQELRFFCTKPSI